MHPLRPVHSLVYEGLVAVVSQVPLEEFGAEALRARLEDAAWLEREVRGHERVIEKVMQRRPVLPMKFCTIFLTEDNVRAFLQRDQDEFRRALARLRGREEWEVKIYHHPPSPPTTRACGSALSGREYLMQKNAAELAAQEAAVETCSQAQRMFEMLTGCVDEIELKPVAPSRSPGSPRLVLDAVCLLAKPRLKAFSQQLEGLGNELSSRGFHFQLSGPWPPYHFCNQAPENVDLS